MNNNDDKLIEWLLSDISNNNNLKELNNTYKWQSYTVNYFGIVYFVIDKLVCGVFNDLVALEHNNNNNNNNNSDNNDTSKNANTNRVSLMFPKLETFFKFLYNFSVYCHCCPSYNDTKKEESYYISQYFLFKSNDNLRIYNNLFDFVSDKYDSNSQVNGNFTLGEVINHGFIQHPNLTILNYFDYEDYNGTVLHFAVIKNYYYYCQILIKNGFNPKLRNVAKASNGGRSFSKTPINMAKQRGYLAILELLSQSQLQSQSSNNESNWNSSNNGNSDDKSIAIRYDSFVTQLMFSKYFLMQFGFISDNNSDDLTPKHKMLATYSAYNSEHFKTCYFDDLFCDTNELKGLIGGNNNNSVKIEEFVGAMVMAIIDLINKKMVICDDLLVLCFGMCKMCKEMQFNNKNNINYYDLFINTLDNATHECLASKSLTKSNNNNDSYNNQNTRKIFNFFVVFMIRCVMC